VKVSFKSRKLARQLTVPKEMKKTYGSITLPAARCHKLKGDREGQYAVSISGNYRLIFKPDHDPVPGKKDQSIDAIRVNDIHIMGTEDYH
jgi:proteic killer suppression protein